MRLLDASKTHVQAVDPNKQQATVWTDGSVMWAEHLLLTCAGFAVVNELGQYVTGLWVATLLNCGQSFKPSAFPMVLFAFVPIVKHWLTISCG